MWDPSPASAGRLQSLPAGRQAFRMTLKTVAVKDGGEIFLKFRRHSL